MTTEKIKRFLEHRSWVCVNRSEAFYTLKPPVELNLPEDFLLYLPIGENKVDSRQFTINLFEIIADIYELTTDDLKIVLENENTVMKIRIYDENTENGSIPLNKFEELIERIRFVLSDVASFTIDKSVTSTRVPPEVSRYLNLCNFMQTEKGSFIAKIQLPSKELIKDREIFDKQEIYSYQINNKLNEILEFIKIEIFEKDINTSEEFIIDNEEKINIKLFKNIESIFEKTNSQNIDFTFHSIEGSTTIINENITKAKLFKLNQFVEKIESLSFELGDFEFKGKITTLKSNNPDGLKNSVMIAGIHEEMIMVALANLESDQYKKAIEAHKLKQNIVISGLAKRTKTRVRFIEITNFEIVE